MTTTTTRINTLKGWTPEEMKTVHGAAQAVWQYIGGDCLQAVADEKGKDINAVTMSRAQVVELVIDAGRLEEQLLQADRYSASGQRLSPEEQVAAQARAVALAAKFNTLTYAAMQRLVGLAFTYGRYGM